MAGLPGLPPPGFSQAIATSSGLPGLPPPGFSSVTEEPSSSGLDVAVGAMKGIGQGALGLFTAPADLLYKGGMEAVNALTGNDIDPQGGYPSQRVEQLYDWVSGNRGSETAETVGELGTNLATVMAVPSQAGKIASKIPLLSKVAQGGGAGSTLANLLAKAIGYGTEGAAYSALGNSTKDNPFEDAGEGATLNIAIPTALKVAGGLAKGLSNTTTDAARKLELSAFGATQGKIGKAYEKSPEILDQMGRRENPLSLAIKAFRRDGGGKGSMEGQALLDDLGKQSGKYLGELTEELTKATAKQTDAIIPKFTFTQKYIDGLPGAVKSEAQAIADDLIAKTVNNTDGTLLSIQNEKTGLAPIIKESAYGNNANPIKTNVLKYLKGDLRRTIEDGYSQVTGQSASRIKKLNDEIGHRESLEPLFEHMRNVGEARDPAKFLIQNWKTTGGFGVPALIAANAAAPVVGTAVPIAGGLLATPAGRRALSNGLKSGLIQTPLKGTTQGADLLSGPLGRALSIAESGSREDLSSSPSSRFDSMNQSEQYTQKQEGSSQVSPLLNRTTGKTANQRLLSRVLGIPEGGENMARSPEFDAKVKDIADNLGADPEHLFKAMAFETGGTFDPGVTNKAGSGATGLIQFLGKTAKNLTGADSEKAALKILSDMSATEQLDYVEKYLKPFKGKLNSLEDVYMAILWPKAVGKDSGYELFKEGTKAYWQNKGLDLNKDGTITKSEATSKVRSYEV